MNSHQIYRADLQIIRGTSILLVFLYHLKIPWFQNGFLGVDIFFVLSGFLMAILTEKVSPIEFYARRLKRLLPAYFVVVLVATAVVITITIPVNSNQRLDRIFYDLVGLSNFAFWYESPYFSASEFKPLLNFWSLAVEIQFYLLAPFLLPFLHKRKFMLLLVILCSLLLSMVLITISPKTSFFMLPTRLWEFLFGACAAWFTVTNSKNKFTSGILLTAICVLLAVIFFYPLQPGSLSILTGHPSIAALIVVTSTTAIIALRLDKIVSIESRLSQVLIKLGDYSYSIYLVHFPIIVLVNYTGFEGTRLGYTSISQLLSIVALTIISSFMLYNYVEKLRYRKHIIGPILGLATTCLALGIFGSSLNKLGYTQSEILIFSAWEDRAVYRCGKLSRVLNPTSTECLIGSDLGGDRVLLLGNSHADSIKTVFQDAMEDNEITTFFYVYNAPLASSSHNAESIRSVVVRNGIDSIVIHYHPNFFNYDDHLAEITSLVEIMKADDIPVLFIAPVPIYENHIPRAMYQLLNEPSLSLEPMDVERYTSTTHTFDKFISDSNINRENVWYPSTVFCPDRECVYQKDGVPYYFDSNHLALTGALQLKPLMDEIGSYLALNN